MNKLPRWKETAATDNHGTQFFILPCKKNHCIEANIERSAFVSQAVACLVAHINLSIINPFWNAQLLLKCKELSPKLCVINII